MSLMGGLLSRFRKKLSTKETLENIEQDIQTIEDHKWSTIRSQKNMIGLLFFVSGFAYITLALVLYFYYLPRSVNWQEKLFYALPLFILPIIFFTFKRAVHWYYRWDIDRQEDKLRGLKRKKRKILDKVMETETYIVAKELLEKYDPSALLDKGSRTSSPDTSTNISSGLRYRSTGGILTSQNTLNTSIRTPRPVIGPRPGFTMTLGISPRPGMGPIRPALPPPSRLSRPILPHQRGIAEKLVDYVVGDGPSNRYALICNSCQCHNGMALKDEFEYIGFRCCYCYFYNPPRKQRLPAQNLLTPRLLGPVVDEPESDAEKKDGSVSSDDSIKVMEELQDEKEVKNDQISGDNLVKDEDDKPYVNEDEKEQKDDNMSEDDRIDDETEDNEQRVLL